MQCPHCHAENRPGARFCGHCGEVLEVQPEAVEAAGSLICSVCGSSLKPGAKFCGRCGNAVAVEAVPESQVSWEGARRPEPRPEAGPPGLEAWVGVPEPSAQRDPFERTSPVAQVQGIRDVPRPDATAVRQVSRPARSSPWPYAAVMLLLSASLSCCLVMVLATAPASGRSVPPPGPPDSSRHDITILVEEAYLSDMVGESLPAIIDGEAALDVQPEGLVVVTIDFQVLIIRLQVVVISRISVEDGRIRVDVESIETGGHDLLDLIGMDDFTLGEDITGAIQNVLEDELGEGARLMTISTDEARVILTARWE
jgi:hypothetical protein